jgi:hypothetical protein
VGRKWRIIERCAKTTKKGQKQKKGFRERLLHLQPELPDFQTKNPILDKFWIAL